MDGREAWEGTASELLSMLEPMASGLPADGTRLSKELFGLASQLAARGIGIERLPRGRQRGVRVRVRSAARESETQDSDYNCELFGHVTARVV